MKRVGFISVFLLSYFILHGKKHYVEQWSDTPSYKCSRVKVITGLDEKTLFHNIVYQIFSRHDSVNTFRTTARSIYSTEMQTEQYKYRFHYELADSIVIISGEYGTPGIGGTYWQTIYRGKDKNTIGKPWEMIEVTIVGLAIAHLLYSNQ